MRRIGGNLSFGGPDCLFSWLYSQLEINFLLLDSVRRSKLKDGRLNRLGRRRFTRSRPLIRTWLTRQWTRIGYRTAVAFLINRADAKKEVVLGHSLHREGEDAADRL